MPARPRNAPLVALVVAGLVLAGCGGGEGSDPEPGATATATPPSGAAGPSACASDAGLAQVPPLHPSVDDYPRTRVALVGPEGCRVDLAVLVADTEAHRRHGLMEVPVVPEGTGMLFVYPADPGPRDTAFWMAHTLAPLDIAYLDGDGAIVDIVAMEPCPSGEGCPTYPSDTPWVSTLEVAQGWFAQVGVEEDAGWRLNVIGEETS